jgi:hypothetical protein
MYVKGVLMYGKSSSDAFGMFNGWLHHTCDFGFPSKEMSGGGNMKRDYDITTRQLSTR